MKIKKMLSFATILGVGAYVYSRYKQLEPRENKEKRLLSLNDNHDTTYIYLDKEFVKTIKEQKNNFNQSYPNYTKVKIYHTVTFDNNDLANHFSLVLINSDFNIEKEQESTLKIHHLLEVDNENTLVDEILKFANLVIKEKGKYINYIIEIV